MCGGIYLTAIIEPWFPINILGILLQGLPFEHFLPGIEDIILVLTKIQFPFTHDESDKCSGITFSLLCRFLLELF